MLFGGTFNNSVYGCFFVSIYSSSTDFGVEPFKEIEISRLELTVIKDNIKAFNLYRKMGFILEGEKVHSLIINGEPVNEYYLYKLL